MAKLPHLQHLQQANAIHKANAGLVGKSAGGFEFHPKGAFAMHPKAPSMSVQSPAQHASTQKAAAVSAEKRRATPAGRPNLIPGAPSKPGKPGGA